MSGNPEGQGEETQKRQPPKPRATIIRIFRALKRYENRRRRRRNSQHQINERMMARWTRHVGLFTGALVVVGIVTAVIFLRQLNVMQGQLEAMRDEFTATNRPWISLDSKPEITAPMVFGGDGNITLSVQFSLFNSGRTPGIFVYPHVTAILMTTGYQLSQIIDKTGAYCAIQSLGEFSPMESGILVPPGKRVTHPFHFGITITTNDVQAGKMVASGREAILPYIGGCIIYQFTFGEKRRHQTRFVYQLVGPGPGTLIFLDGGNIPIDKLSLIEQDGAWAD